MPIKECPYCAGTGQRSGKSDFPCPFCYGTGSYSYTSQKTTTEESKDKLSEFINAVINISKRMSGSHKPRTGIIHMAECCVNCIYHSDATVTTGQCEKHSKVIVHNNQVCDYFDSRDE